MKLLIYFLIIILISINIVSGLGTLGDVRVNTPINITQGCAGSTYSNISLITRDNIALNTTEISMTKVGTASYVFTYTPNQTGYYYVLTHCNENGADVTAPLDFYVTPTGYKNTIESAVVYIIMLVILTGFLILNIWGGLVLPSENIRSNDNYIVQIQWKKYLKYFCWTMVYLSIVWISYVCWNLSFAFLNLEGLTNMFRMIYITAYTLVLPIIASMFVFGIIKIVNDRKILTMLERGLNVR